MRLLTLWIAAVVALWPVAEAAGQTLPECPPAGAPRLSPATTYPLEVALANTLRRPLRARRGGLTVNVAGWSRGPDQQCRLSALVRMAPQRVVTVQLRFERRRWSVASTSPDLAPSLQGTMCTRHGAWWGRGRVRVIRDVDDDGVDDLSVIGPAACLEGEPGGPNAEAIGVGEALVSGANNALLWAGKV